MNVQVLLALRPDPDDVERATAALLEVWRSVVLRRSIDD